MCNISAATSALCPLPYKLQTGKAYEPTATTPPTKVHGNGTRKPHKNPPTRKNAATPRTADVCRFLCF